MNKDIITLYEAIQQAKWEGVLSYTEIKADREEESIVVFFNHVAILDHDFEELPNITLGTNSSFQFDITEDNTWDIQQISESIFDSDSSWLVPYSTRIVIKLKTFDSRQFKLTLIAIDEKE